MQFSSRKFAKKCEFDKNARRLVDCSRCVAVQDQGGDDRIGDGNLVGVPLIDDDTIYLPIASGRRDKDGVVKLIGQIHRYTRVKVNGHVVLLSDEAMEEFDAGKRLNGYGVFILKKEVNFARVFDSKSHELPSIRLLYADD